jgi:hypothetical protein
MRVILACVALALVVSGCRTVAERRAERDGNICEKHGFVRGTAEYLQCLSIQGDNRSADAAANAARSAALLDYSARTLAPQPRLSTTCTKVGLTLVCN